ncbi:hypothetical protein HDU86_007269 [Geranomyces michiganensis]|nr:hypothetical protein HDU86_007269 [Geranomyces michiganensis]
MLTAQTNPFAHHDETTATTGPTTTPPRQKQQQPSQSSFASFIISDDFAPRRPIDSPFGRGPVSTPNLMGRRKHNATARAAAASAAAAANAAAAIASSSAAPAPPTPTTATRAISAATPNAVVGFPKPDEPPRRTSVSTPVSRTPLDEESPPIEALADDAEATQSVLLRARRMLDDPIAASPTPAPGGRMSVAEASPALDTTTAAGIEESVDRQFREIVGGAVQQQEEEESLSDIEGAAEEEKLSESDDFLTDSQLPTADGEGAGQDAPGLDDDQLLRMLASVDSETRHGDAETESKDDSGSKSTSGEYLSGSFSMEEIPDGFDMASDEDMRQQRDAATILAAAVELEVGELRDPPELLLPAEAMEFPEITPSTASASFREADQGFLLEGHTATTASWLDDAVECEALTAEMMAHYPTYTHGREDAENFDQDDAAFNEAAEEDQQESSAQGHDNDDLDDDEQAEEIGPVEEEDDQELDRASPPGSPHSSTSSFSSSRRNTVLFVGEGSQEAIAAAAAAGAASTPKRIPQADTPAASAIVSTSHISPSYAFAGHKHRPTSPRASPIATTKGLAKAPTAQSSRPTSEDITLKTLIARHSASLKAHTADHPRLLNTYLAAHETRCSEALSASARSPRNIASMSQDARAYGDNGGNAGTGGGLAAVQVFDVCRAIERHLSDVRALKTLETEAEYLIVEADERNKAEYESQLNVLQRKHEELDASEKRIAAAETRIKQQNTELEGLRATRERLVADIEEAKARVAAAEVAKGDVVMVPVTGGFATTAFFTGIFFAVVGAMMIWQDPLHPQFVPV